MLTNIQPIDAQTAQQSVTTPQPAAATSLEFDLMEAELKQAQRRRTINVWAMTILVFGGIVAGFFVFFHEAQTVSTPVATMAPATSHAVGTALPVGEPIVPVAAP